MPKRKPIRPGINFGDQSWRIRGAGDLRKAQQMKAGRNAGITRRLKKKDRKGLELPPISLPQTSRE